MQARFRMKILFCNFLAKKKNVYAQISQLRGWEQDADSSGPRSATNGRRWDCPSTNRSRSDSFSANQSIRDCQLKQIQLIFSPARVFFSSIAAGDTRGPPMRAGDTCVAPVRAGDTCGTPIRAGNTCGPPMEAGDTCGPPMGAGDTCGPPMGACDTCVPPIRAGDTCGPPMEAGDSRGPPMRESDT